MNIKELFEKLQKLTYKELFGDTEESETTKYKQYAILCHPDTCNDPLAEQCFKLLQQRKNEKNKPPAIISIRGKSVYTFDKTTLFEGDFTNEYITLDGKLIIKISKDPKLNILLKNEADKLKEVLPEKDSHFNYYLPKLVESFVVVQTNKINLQANVFEAIPPTYYSLEEIKEKHPKIDVRNAAWMINRLFEIVSYSHSKGIIHANILPNSFLVDPVTKPLPKNLCHGGILINWENATKIGETARFINKEYADFFPVEVLNKKPVGYETDIYMIGRICQWLCQDFTAPIKRFFDSTTIQKMRYRPDDCFDLYKEFKELLFKCYGPKRFVNLDI